MYEDRVLIFLHIPKTAGTTLRQIISQQYAEDAVHTLYEREDVEAWKNLPAVKTKKVKLLQGHQRFGLHTDLGLSAEYITMLRDPVERVVSHYYWIKSTPGNDLYAEVAKMRLEDFAASGLPHATNQQTEFISGMDDPQDAGTLDVAQNNLTVHFRAFGLVEYFDQSLLLFKKILGWRNLYYFKRNVGATRPGRDEIPKETIESIRKKCEVDVALYEFAKRRFEETIRQHGLLFPYQLGSFRLRNRIYRRAVRNTG